MSNANDWPPTQARGPQFTTMLGDRLAEHNIGPEELAKLAAALYARTLREMRPGEILMEYTGSTQTDSNGNASLKLWDVPAGSDLAVTRVVGEMAGVTPASAANVSNPAGAGWVGIFETDGGSASQISSALNGALRDFGPATAAAAIFPFLMTDGRHQSWAYRAGASVWFACFSAKASTQIWIAARAVLIPKG